VNNQAPVAWAQFFPNGGPQSVYLDRPPAEAEPLYRSPTLTDEEREAIEDAVGICEEHAEEYDGTDNSPIAATLRSLLERTK